LFLEHGAVKLLTDCNPDSIDFQLSCISKDNATCFDPKVTLLSKYDFIVPGMGLKPVYCGTPYANGIKDTFDGAHIAFTACKKMQCPDCSDHWRLQNVFKYSVLIEAFSRYCGSRPCKGNYSISPDQKFTLEDIKNFNRNGKDRLRRQGMFAGIYFFHGFRIIKIVNKIITKLTGDSSSSGHWNYILNEDNIPILNKHLPFKIKSLHDLVYLGPHDHFVGFPGNILVTGDKKGKINIKKEPYEDEETGEEIWELQDVEAVFRYVMYLSSHVTTLNNGSRKSHLKIFNPFGELDKVKLLDLVTPKELHKMQKSVLNLINCRREQKFDIKDGKLVYAVPEEKEKNKFIPIAHFRYSSIIGQENAIKLIKHVNQFCPTNAEYLAEMIKMYNNVMNSRDVPFKFKRLFITPLQCDPENLPGFVKRMDDKNPVKQLFTEGLKAPPETFTFYFNTYLTEKEQQYKDKFKLGIEIDDKGLQKPIFIDPDSEQAVTIEQAVKPAIKKDDPAFIASKEKSFLKLRSESMLHADS
jgi:hypothetical protein